MGKCWATIHIGMLIVLASVNYRFIGLRARHHCCLPETMVARAALPRAILGAVLYRTCANENQLNRLLRWVAVQLCGKLTLINSVKCATDFINILANRTQRR